MEPFRAFRTLICSIPGISTLTADVVVAETGGDMTRFPTAKHLASWAGTTPDNNESTGKVKPGRTRPGNPYLQGALGAAAMACAQNPRTYLGAKYRRIAVPADRLSARITKANVSVQRAMLTTIWHMGTTGTSMRIPGRTTSLVSTPTEPRTAPSTSLRPWATTSPSTEPKPPEPRALRSDK